MLKLRHKFILLWIINVYNYGRIIFNEYRNEKKQCNKVQSRSVNHISSVFFLWAIVETCTSIKEQWIMNYKMLHVHNTWWKHSARINVAGWQFHWKFYFFVQQRKYKIDSNIGHVLVLNDYWTDGKMATTDWNFAALLCAYSYKAAGNLLLISILVYNTIARLNKHNWNINKIFDYNFLMRVTLIKLKSNSWLKLKANLLIILILNINYY